MSEEIYTPDQNDIRYEVNVGYSKEGSLVHYKMTITDMGLGMESTLVFRFSEAKKFHDKLVKTIKKDEIDVPDFPQRNSFFFWNRTNTDHRKIDNRIREL